MNDAHSAAGPALGYQYQADYGLLTFVRDGEPGRAITLELHDDVAWDDSGTPVEQLQVKHSVAASSTVGDTSPQIWRTLKAWLDAGNPANPDGPSLVLVTTSTAVDGSAAYLLREDSRDAPTAANLLRTAAADANGAKKTAVARAAFMKLSVAEQNAFVARIRVVDGTPNVLDIDAALRVAVRRHLPADEVKQDAFMDALWGWWRRHAVDMLSSRFFPDRNLRTTVEEVELNNQLNRLAVAHSDLGLPEYDDLDIQDGHEDLVVHEDDIFVHQLKFLDYAQTARTVRNAIIDYHRAVANETRWLERDFLNRDEVEKYEKKLREAWRIVSGFLFDDLPADASEPDRVQAGRRLLRSILSATPVRIRTHVDQDFYYRGKHHMLAEDGLIGWHPDFEERVQAVLLAKESVA